MGAPTNVLMDTVGPLAVAPGLVILLQDHASMRRLVAAAAAQAFLTICFAAAAVVAARHSAERHERIETWWASASGLLAGVLPWLIAPTTAAGYFGVGLLFGAMISIDTVYSAFRPGKRWRAVLATSSLSVVAFMAVNTRWSLAISIALLASVLLGAHDAIESLVLRLRRETHESQRLAETDPLTGLANRRRLHAFLHKAASADRAVVIAQIDLDDFKQINDRYGHAGGDRVLIGFAEHLQSSLGSSWLCVRSGGDEFVCVSATTTIDDARQRFRAVPAQLFDGALIPVRISVGLASGTPSDDLLADASAALRSAKMAGKRRVIVADESLREALAEQRQLGAHLSEAISRSEIDVWAQPIVSLLDDGSTEVYSYECLARWKTAEGLEISPSVFIPMVEDQHLTRELGESMINAAVEFATSIDNGAKVSVNVSASHFVDHSFIPFLHRAIERAAIDPGAITVELTESEEAPSAELAWAVARQLRQMGVGLAIDDFGTGYGSLERLLRFPCTQLKLDRSIIEHAHETGIEHLLAAFGVMSSESGIEIVAEGVETPDQAELLRAIGIRLAQGFLFDRPRPVAEILADEGVAWKPTPFVWRPDQPTVWKAPPSPVVWRPSEHEVG